MINFTHTHTHWANYTDSKSGHNPKRVTSQRATPDVPTFVRCALTQPWLLILCLVCLACVRLQTSQTQFICICQTVWMPVKYQTAQQSASWIWTFFCCCLAAQAQMKPNEEEGKCDHKCLLLKRETFDTHLLTTGANHSKSQLQMSQACDVRLSAIRTYTAHPCGFKYACFCARIYKTRFKCMLQ